ncbi:MAG: DUF2007 domain-containing protein [candidate division NC10 bacterium]|nr:DUF2007 domain-containing protein [candidate division NC10 bacterium]
MSRPEARCPQCAAAYPWGTTVCPTCHVGLELTGSAVRQRPTALIFETWDRPSVDVVVSLLEAHGVSCLVRGTGDTIHFGIGPASFWRVFVRPSDERFAQEILDAEIGQEAGE